MLKKVAEFFKFKENDTNFRTEIIAGITTFFGMAYILAVNPQILTATGMNGGSVYTATILAAFIGTVLMALLANYPFALAPGMGLNAYFAYTVVLQMGYTWEQALTAVFLVGIIFVLLTLTNLREGIFNAIPSNLRRAITAGIGLFIAMIGLMNAQIMVRNDNTLVSLYSWTNQTNPTIGLTVILAILGILITAYMYCRGWNFAILAGIFITWLLGIFCQFIGWYIPDPSIGLNSLIPDFSYGIFIPSIAPTFFKFDFNNIFTFDFLIVIFSFLFVDLFDTIGTLMGCSLRAGFIKDNESLPRIKNALLADAFATSIGACLGTSTTTTLVESSLGVLAGGRTGFAALVTALLFLCSLVLAPIFLTIPSWASAPALVIVGFLMMQSVTEIDFNDPTEGIPCFLCIAAMPLFYSISEGIGWGIISYTVLNTAIGKAKKVNGLLYFITALFILKYIFL